MLDEAPPPRRGGDAGGGGAQRAGGDPVHRRRVLGSAARRVASTALGDLNWALRLIHVRRSYVAGVEQVPRSGKVGSVPLIDQAATALDRLSRRDHFTADDELIFPSPTGHYADDARIRRDFAAALRRSGLTRIRFHDLRHTFGTLAVQAFPLSDVKAYMGHADIATTMIYVHHVPAPDAADRLTEIVRDREADVRGTLCGHLARNPRLSSDF